MTSPCVRAWKEPEGFACIEMDDPGHHNAFGEQMIDGLSTAFAGVGDARAIVLLGAGEVFSSGAPRALLRRLVSGDTAPGDIRLPRLLLEASVPCLAVMEGHAVGGGFALGLAADIVLMAEESRYGLPFLDLGFTPGMGTTRLLEHVLSPAMAHELLYSGEMRRGSAFARCGGVNHVLPRTELRAKAFDLARRLAAKPLRPLRLLKRTLSLPRRQAFEATLTLESLMHELTFGDPETRRRLEESGVE